MKGVRNICLADVESELMESTRNPNAKLESRLPALSWRFEIYIEKREKKGSEGVARVFFWTLADSCCFRFRLERAKETLHMGGIS